MVQLEGGRAQWTLPDPWLTSDRPSLGQAQYRQPRLLWNPLCNGCLIPRKSLSPPCLLALTSWTLPLPGYPLSLGWAGLNEWFRAKYSTVTYSQNSRQQDPTLTHWGLNSFMQALGTHSYCSNCYSKGCLHSALNVVRKNLFSQTVQETINITWWKWHTFITNL